MSTECLSKVHTVSVWNVSVKLTKCLSQVNKMSTKFTKRRSWQNISNTVMEVDKMSVKLTECQGSWQNAQLGWQNVRKVDKMPSYVDKMSVKLTECLGKVDEMLWSEQSVSVLLMKCHSRCAAWLFLSVQLDLDGRRLLASGTHWHKTSSIVMSIAPAGPQWTFCLLQKDGCCRSRPFWGEKTTKHCRIIWCLCGIPGFNAFGFFRPIFFACNNIKLFFFFFIFFLFKQNIYIYSSPFV